MSILSEYFHHGDIETMTMSTDSSLDLRKVSGQPELKSFNKIAPAEKLRISIQMAEALCDLHGHKGGVIVHQDVQLSQYLFNEDKVRESSHPSSKACPSSTSATDHFLFDNRVS